MRGEVIAPSTTAAEDPPAPADAAIGPGRCLVLGMLTVTPDAFSDGGKTFRPDLAIGRGLDLARRGADIIDVGGESVRPGAAPIPLAEEMRRVLPWSRTWPPRAPWCRSTPPGRGWRGRPWRPEPAW